MKRLSIAVLVLLSLLLTGCTQTATNKDDELQPLYTQASELLEKGDLQQAYDLFVQLGDYKDSAQHAEKFVYLPKEILAEDDGFGEAIALFRTTFEYNENGQLLKEYGTYTNNEGPGYSEVNEYDKEGKVILTKTESEAGFSTITYEYNGDGQLIKRVGCTDGANVGGISVYEYDADGNCIRVSNKSYLGIDTETYESKEPYSTDTVEYTYNEQGLCTGSVNYYGDNSSVCTVEYTDSGLPTSIKIIYEDNSIGDAATFTYDEKGRCIKVETSYNSTTEFTYDNGDLPVSAITTRDGGKPCNVSYTYELYYVEGEKAAIPFHLEQYFSVLKV